MALIAVLWLVAALSIMVASLSTSIRQEARTLSGKRDMVAAQAVGDAVVQLVLQKVRAAERVPDQWSQLNVAYSGQTVVAQITPLTGLIDLNQADLPLLSRLLTVAGELAPEHAAALAQTIIDTRQQRDSRGSVMRFEAEEDLLKVPGVTYDLYARLVSLVTLEGRGSSRVNAKAAPPPVLLVLANGDVRTAEMIHAKRLSGDVGIDMSGLDTSLTDNSSSNRLKITAVVPVDAGKSVHVSRSVDVMAPAPDGTPWSTYRTSSSIQLTTPVN
ncbi:MAG: general secretion pathway protein GspK [Gammaproteobacteria bacterium]|nr:general secretion pathway protein GspK [Gammaproteobacteria bacterium]MBU1507010.1 general secretion pathway protein GspK [Gammaproteobacteria bacterium]MBU2121788.1 general secretion pathway protein GspK [Gammaproteobacteria bacterium]MBU2172807.1 general secretion pathway protein GspK [Gammaproteobacteria bacterium]MBU2200689.1 general secretion pathway protein GspK [Gammaproteobacteria bacterium]